MCLLYGCRLNAALRMGDPLLRLNAERCLEEHRLLDRAGRAYRANVRRLLGLAVDIGIVKRLVDLSVDPTHVLYWGEKAVKRWGSPFSTMMNRALPGLYPLTCLDLLSGMFLLASDFIGKARKDRKGRTKDLGKVTGKKILRCIDLLRDAGVRVRSVTGDEGMCSDYLIEELGKRGINHLLAMGSRTKLRALVPTIERWTRLEDGKLLGIKRDVEHNGVRTNLIVVKDDDGTYLYVSSYTKVARYVWERLCKRGGHENKIGVEVDRSGGREALDVSLPGQGTRVRLHLPAHAPEGALRESRPRPEHGAGDDQEPAHKAVLRQVGHGRQDDSPRDRQPDDAGEDRQVEHRVGGRFNRAAMASTTERYQSSRLPPKERMTLSHSEPRFSRVLR
jgi:hypothetical protein